MVTRLNSYGKMYLINITLRILFLIIFAFMSKEVAAQPSSFSCDCAFEVKYLSLHDAVCLALRSNPEIRSAELQRVVDRFALEVARNQFFPQYILDASATYSNGTKPYYEASPKINFLSPIGTYVELAGDNFVNNNERQTVGKLQLTQPLLRGFGPAVTLAGYRNAKDAEIISRLNFKSILMTTISNVVESYYKLTQDYNTLTIDRISLNDAIKLLKITEERIKAGKVAATEVVQQKVQIANLRLALTRDQNVLCQDYRDLLIKLGLDPRSNLNIDKKINVMPIPIPTCTEAICIALANNVEYLKSLAVLRQLQRDLIVAKNEQLPRLDVTARGTQEFQNKKRFANVEINQLDGIGNDTPDNDRTLIVNLSIPIHDVARKQRLVQANIALKQFNIALETQRQQLIAAVMNATQNLQTQLQQIKLAKDAVTYSQQSLSIAQKKFQYGRTTMFEITSLQKNLILQRLALISQEIAYLNAITEFEKLLGISLERWGIKILC